MRPLKVTYEYISSIVSSRKNKCNSQVMCHLFWLGYLQTAFLSAVDLFYCGEAAHCARISVLINSFSVHWLKTILPIITAGIYWGSSIFQKGSFFRYNIDYVRSLSSYVEAEYWNYLGVRLKWGNGYYP